MTPRDKSLELSNVRITPKTAIYQITHEGEQLWALICGVQTQMWIFNSQEIFCQEQWQC